MNTHENFRRDQSVRGPSERAFGLVFAVVFAVLALLPLWRGSPVRWWSLAVAAAFVAAALLWPPLLRPLNWAWTRLGLVLQRIVNPIILGVLFYLVFTPFGLVGRLLGKDPLRRRFDSGAPTYWLPRQPPGPPPESMSNQF